MPAYGLSGPRRDQVAYAQTVEQFAGLCARTGYADGDPLNPNGVADPFGGFNAAFAALAALRSARHTGEGSLVEAALAEGAITIASEQVIARTLTGKPLQRLGNASESVPLQGVFPLRGEEEWVAVSILTHDQLRAIGEQIHPGANHEPDETLFAEWTGTRDAAEVLSALTTLGVPCALVADARFMYEEEQVAATRYYETVEHPVAGRLSTPTVPFRDARRPEWVASPAPTLGQHTREVLMEVAKMDETSVNALIDSGLCATEPVRS